MKTRTFIITSLLIAALSGQPTLELVNNVTRVASDRKSGAIFSIEVDGREYWLTVKHIVNSKDRPPYGFAGVASITLHLQNRVSSSWIPVAFKVLDPGENIDIVVLAADHSLLQELGDLAPLVKTDHLAKPVANTDGILVGNTCGFLGYPFDAWRATFANSKSFLFPYAKGCTLAGKNEAEGYWWLDGFDNHGFSGGPVYFGTGPALKIIGVISGYVSERADVTHLTKTTPTRPGEQSEVHEEPTDYKAQVNSGFFHAYDITKALTVIHDHPIGASLTSRAK